MSISSLEWRIPLNCAYFAPIRNICALLGERISYKEIVFVEVYLVIQSKEKHMKMTLFFRIEHIATQIRGGIDYVCKVYDSSSKCG